MDSNFLDVTSELRDDAGSKRSGRDSVSADTDYDEENMVSDNEIEGNIGKNQRNKSPDSPNETKRGTALTSRQRSLLSGKDSGSFTSQLSFQTDCLQPLLEIMQMHRDIMKRNIQATSSGVTAQFTGLMGLSEPVNQQDNVQDVNKPYIVCREDMIKWNEPHDLESTSVLTNSLRNQHTTSQDLGLVCLTETACLFSSSLTDYNHPFNDMDIPNSVSFTPVSSGVSLGEIMQ